MRRPRTPGFAACFSIPRLAILGALALACVPSAADSADPSGPPGADDGPDGGHPVALDIAIGFEDDVPSDVLAAWVERVRAASSRLHRLTQGQFHIGSCTLEDESSDAAILVPSGATRAVRLEPSHAPCEVEGGGTDFWRVEICGVPDGSDTGFELGSVLARALAMAELGLTESHERSAADGSSGARCLLGRDPERLCGPDDPDHAWPRSCRELLAERYFGLVLFPNPRFDPAAPPPETRFEVRDRS